MHQVLPKTSPEGIRRFMEGNLHQDFLAELTVRIEERRDALEEAEEKLQDGITHEMTRGSVITIRELKDVFGDILVDAENALMDKEKEVKDGT
jgi:hypothetical protein